MKFINDQYEKYLQEELNINRKKRIPDTRVHCCIYFIPATGHSYVGSFLTPSPFVMQELSKMLCSKCLTAAGWEFCISEASWMAL